MDIKSNQTIGLTCKLRYIDRQIDAAATLVHAFVTSRLDHCCSVLVGLPLTMTARLDRVLRFAARLIGGVPKYASISGYMHDTGFPFGSASSTELLCWYGTVLSALPQFTCRNSVDLCRPWLGIKRFIPILVANS